MAATIDTTRQTAKILPFRRLRKVDQTDRMNRLPTLTADQIDSFFDQATLRLAA